MRPTSAVSDLFRPLTRSHVAASSETLTDLANLVSSHAGPTNSDNLHVRLALYEHGAFLSPLLHGFVLHMATGKKEPQRKIPLLPQPPQAHTLHLPTITDDQHYLTYAIVANNSVELQIQHTLSTLARLIARREITARILNDGITDEIPRLANESDTKADAEISDTIRSSGWREAARLVSARAHESGTPFVVSFNSSLMSSKQIGFQAPVLRRIYNESGVIREAIDKTAVLLSQGMTTRGGSTQDVAGFVRDYLDIGSSRTYLAHLARDAFVCGNGYMSYGAVPDQDIRLLLPETVTIEGKDRYLEVHDGTSVIHTKVCHITGGDQQASAYGTSVLEPFISLQLQKEQWTTRVATAAAWNFPEVPRREREYAVQMGKLGESFLESFDEKCRELIGAPKTLDVEIPADLYFSGQQTMAPAAEAIAMPAEAIEDA
jgi:hypothetical protein